MLPASCFLLPASCRCRTGPHQPWLLQALCLRLCRPLCGASPQSLGRSPANPSQGGCPMCGCPERSFLALSPLGLGGVGAMQKGWTPSTPYSPRRQGSLSPSLVPTCLPSVGALRRGRVVGASRPPLSREPFPRGMDSHGVSRGVTDPVIGFSRRLSAAVSRAGTRWAGVAPPALRGMEAPHRPPCCTQSCRPAWGSGRGIAQRPTAHSPAG